MFGHPVLANARQDRDASSTVPSPAEREHRPHYRPDIDGLRAVAILLVVSYHVWLGRVSGGVDAFLMISAFFLTGTYIRRLESQAALRITGQWVRTFRRLLPAAAVVLTATIVAGSIILPASGLNGLWQHTWAALFYSENWLLAAESVDYYADTSLASPVQHFWSLSVQGQVFILWPLIFGVIALIRRTAKIRRVRVLALVVFTIVFAGSLGYSVVTTATRQEFAYFDTGARLWEFAAGSILALVLPWIRLPRWTLAVLGWLGLAALLACGMVLDVQGGFPGYLALWPVLSVAAVIISGQDPDSTHGPSRLLRSRPMRFLGRDAYALYLVHWPILVFTLILRSGEPLNAWEGLILIVASLVLARVVTWGVDARVRRLAWAQSGRARGLLIIVVSLAVVALPLSWAEHESRTQSQAIQDRIAQSTPEERRADNPGALVLSEGWDQKIDPDAPMLPLASELDLEWGGLSETCSDPDLPFPTERMRASCSQNRVSDAEVTILVVGDSHTEQWLAPLEPIADEHEWRLLSVLKGGCAFGLRDVPDEVDEEAAEDIEECRVWNERLLEFADELQPDLVVTVGTAAQPTDEDQEMGSGESETVVAGLETAASHLTDSDIGLLLIRDNPRFTFNAYVCLEESDDIGDCEVSRDRALASTNPAEDLNGPQVATIDMSDFICPNDRCPAVIGNVAVYLDDNHLTTTYTATLREFFEPRLLEAIDRISSWSLEDATGYAPDGP